MVGALRHASLSSLAWIGLLRRLFGHFRLGYVSSQSSWRHYVPFLGIRGRFLTWNLKGQAGAEI